jgi:hypothetical protein
METTTQEVNADVQREAAAALSQRISDKVRVQRYPSALGPVVGPALIISPLQKVAEALADSGFMRPWVVQKIREHLLSGGVLTNRGMDASDYEPAIISNGQQLHMQVRSEYRMATVQETLDYVDNQEFANVTGKAVSKRSQDKKYFLRYHEGPALIGAYDALPRQARVILDILNEAGRESFTEASIEMVLTENIERLKTKQEASVLFGFYRKRLLEEGHLEEAGA